MILSARDTECAKVEALTLGADDYLAKPFGMNKLLARIQVALRHAARPAAGAEAVFRAGDLAVDFDRRQVSRGGEAIHLTPTEYDLLKALVTHPDKVLPTPTLRQSRDSNLPTATGMGQGVDRAEVGRQGWCWGGCRLSVHEGYV